MKKNPQPAPDFSLAGKHAVLTGGGGILGARFAAALVRQGARVAVLERDAAKAAAAAAACNDLRPDSARACVVDIGDRAALARLADELEKDWGKTDVLINNAAVKSENFFAPFEEFPLKDWNEVMHVNTTAVMLGCQVFGSRMARRQRGSVINTLSIYGLVAPDQRIYEGSSYEGRPINTPAVYSASKAAVWGLTKYLAAYWGQQGVRVNALTPGGIFSGQNEVFVEKYSRRVPLGRMGQADELCGALVYLASDAASYVTGQNIVIDGGLTVW